MINSFQLFPDKQRIVQQKSWGTAKNRTQAT